MLLNGLGCTQLYCFIISIQSLSLLVSRLTIIGLQPVHLVRTHLAIGAGSLYDYIKAPD